MASNEHVILQYTINFVCTEPSSNAQNSLIYCISSSSLPREYFCCLPNDVDVQELRKNQQHLTESSELLMVFWPIVVSIPNACTPAKTESVHYLVCRNTIPWTNYIVEKACSFASTFHNSVSIRMPYVDLYPHFLLY